ncbi:MAG: phage tail protein, partial [Rhodococcus sp. (in: high G+C Gram-positive bacteria)]
MPKNLRNDPLPVFAFSVDLGMGGQAYFRAVSGLRYETETIPVRAGGVNDTTYNLVGATKWTNLIFKQGFTQSSQLIQWRQEWLQGTSPGKNGKPGLNRIGGTITQLDTAMKPKAQWTFVRGWPCKW